MNEYHAQQTVWHTLNRLADAVATLHSRRLTLGAPVPTNVGEHELNRLLREERQFKETGEHIPQNYKDTLVTLTELMMHYYIQHKYKGFRKFDTPVVILKIGYRGNDAVVEYMHTRPCAMHCGFENLVLWQLRYIVIERKYDGIVFDYCEPYHVRLLEHMGFTKNGSQYSITPDALREATVASWKVKRLREFPTADQLNSQEWVDAKH